MHKCLFFVLIEITWEQSGVRDAKIQTLFLTKVRDSGKPYLILHVDVSTDYTRTRNGYASAGGLDQSSGLLRSRMTDGTIHWIQGSQVTRTALQRPAGEVRQGGLPL